MKTQQSLKDLAIDLIMKVPLTWTHVAGIWGVVLLLLLVPQSYALEVKNQLSHAVQTIKQVVFTADGMPSDKHISVTASPQGVLEINGGNIFAQADASKGNSMTNTTGSLLLYGKENIIQGGETNMIYYGQENEITGSGYSNVILAGDGNKIVKNSESNVIMAGMDWKILGNNSVIIGGDTPISYGNQNALIGAIKATVSGDNNYVFGSNINYTTGRNNTFVWSDNAVRKPIEKNLIPVQDDTFYIRSKAGFGINTMPALPEGVTVNGMVQLGNELVACTKDTVGAMRFIPDVYGDDPHHPDEGCFCGCSKEAGAYKRSPLAVQNKCATACVNGK